MVIWAGFSATPPQNCLSYLLMSWPRTRFTYSRLSDHSHFFIWLQCTHHFGPVRLQFPVKTKSSERLRSKSCVTTLMLLFWSISELGTLINLEDDMKSTWQKMCSSYHRNVTGICTLCPFGRTFPLLFLRSCFRWCTYAWSTCRRRKRRQCEWESFPVE